VPPVARRRVGMDRDWWQVSPGSTWRTGSVLQLTCHDEMPWPRTIRHCQRICVFVSGWACTPLTRQPRGRAVLTLGNRKLHTCTRITKTHTKITNSRKPYILTFTVIFTFAALLRRNPEISYIKTVKHHILDRRRPHHRLTNWNFVMPNSQI